MPKSHSGPLQAPTPQDIGRFFLEIAVSVANGEYISDAKLDKLRHSVHGLTVTALDDESGNPYIIDLDYVGYLKRQLEQVEIFVPFHLCSYFPSGDILSSLVQASRMVLVNESNPICISGSATFLGVASSIADLDFCEYYLLPLNNAGRSVTKLWESNAGDFRVVMAKGRLASVESLK